MREVRRMDNESSQCHNLIIWTTGKAHGTAAFGTSPTWDSPSKNEGSSGCEVCKEAGVSTTATSVAPKTPMIRQWVLVGGRDSTRRHAMLSSSGAACTSFWATRRPVRWRKRRRYVRFCKELRRSRSHGWTRRFASYKGSWWRRTCRQPSSHHSSWSVARKACNMYA